MRFCNYTWVGALQHHANRSRQVVVGRVVGITLLLLTFLHPWVTTSVLAQTDGPIPPLVTLAHGPSSMDSGQVIIRVGDGAPTQVSPFMSEFSPAEFQALKQLANSVSAKSGASEFIQDPSPDVDRLVPPPLLTDFQGISYTSWVPPDPVIATNGHDVMLVVNSTVASYNAIGTVIVPPQTLANFFSTVWTGPGPFDPKVYYDKFGQRWVLLALARDTLTNRSSYLVGVSDDHTITGPWWTWNLDATFDGGLPTNNWADYPGLGFDTDPQGALYITSNQYQFSGPFQYAKLRILYKSILYWVGAGGTALGWDFWNATNSDGSSVFVWKPSEPITSLANGTWLLNTRSGGDNHVTLWRLTNPLAAPPTLVRSATVTIGTYAVPPNAAQLGSATNIETNDCRTQDLVYCSNKLYTTFTEGFNWGSGNRAAIRYLKISSTTFAPLRNVIYGHADRHYYFPKTTPDRTCGCETFVFTRSSTTEYARVRYVGDYATNSASAGIRAGDGPYVNIPVTRNRWGDYSGIWHDPTDGDIYMYGEYATTTLNRWGTWVGKTSCSSNCCQGNRGNIDGDPQDGIDIADLVFLIDYMFTGGPAPQCWEEVNVDGEGPDDGSGIDISDLIHLIDYMFRGGPAPVVCP